MMQVISPNTQAILLLTAPLIAGSGSSSSNILTQGEYKRLARHLLEIQREPADLLSAEAPELLHACNHIIDENRLQSLLNRGFQLSQAIERWQARAIWVVSRADTDYPKRLKVRLREDAPPVLYGCGNNRLLESGGLAVVGSRHVDNALVEFTMAVGQLAASAGRTIVSGGARGIDQAAMRGSLETGGRVIGVLADSLEKTAMKREHRNLLLHDQLVLITPYDPSAGFNVGNAMQRNKLIYALADAALVVNTDLKKGGTWAGAIEQLEKLRLIPVYVRRPTNPSPGLDALHKRGAIPWPNPQEANALADVFNATPSTTPEAAKMRLPFSNGRPSDANSPQPINDATKSELKTQKVAPPPAVNEAKNYLAVANGQTAELDHDTAKQEKFEPANALFAVVREVIKKCLRKPMSESDIAAALDVSKLQARAWLQRLEEEGVVEKQKKPVCYLLKRPGLFPASTQQDDIILGTSK